MPLAWPSCLFPYIFSTHVWASFRDEAQQAFKRSPASLKLKGKASSTSVEHAGNLDQAELNGT